MGFRNPITSLSADRITPGTLPPGVLLPAGQIGAGHLPTDVLAHALADGVVTSPAIAADAILAEHIGAGAVWASRIAVGALQTNLLRNPGFEDTGQAVPTPHSPTVVPGWTFSQRTSGGNDPYRWGNTTDQRRGNGCAVLRQGTAANNGGRLDSDWVPVVVGQTYRAEVWFQNRHTTCQCALYVGYSTDGGKTLAGNSAGTGASPAVGVWTRLTLNYTVPAGVTHINLIVQNQGDGAFGNNTRALVVDDCALVRLGSSAVEITPAGIRMWDASGALSIQLDAAEALISTTALDVGSYVTIGSGLTVYGEFRANADSSFPLGLTASDVWGTRLHLLGPPTTTAGANVNRDPASGQLRVVSSLARYKLDRQVIPALLELLELEPVTWRDAADVAADPETTRRVPGFVAEQVQAVSAAHGGSLDPLLTWDEEGTLQGLAYDRFVAYLVPILAQLHARVRALEAAVTDEEE